MSAESKFYDNYLKRNKTQRGVKSIEMETKYFECTCHSTDHTFKFTYDPEDGDLYLETQLCRKAKNIFQRIWASLKYIFGYQCKYGHWDCTLIEEETAKEMIKVLENVVIKRRINETPKRMIFKIDADNKTPEELQKYFDSVKEEYRQKTFFNNKTMGETINGNDIITNSSTDLVLSSDLIYCIMKNGERYIVKNRHGETYRETINKDDIDRVVYELPFYTFVHINNTDVQESSKTDQ
jgi:hypothetical protein